MAHSIKQFGIFPTPLASEFPQLLRLVEVADDLGLDLVGVQDHPYQRRFLDTFTLMPVLLSRTERITVFPGVSNLPLRGAPILAKAAASMDIMFPGRFKLGLGAGAFPQAAAGLGFEPLRPADAVDAFEEAVEVTRLLWSGERGLRYDGDHYHLAGTHSGPVPITAIDIWSGAGGPRMLEITGRLCDGWFPSSTWAVPEKLAGFHARIDEGAEAAGREPGDIRRVYNVAGQITNGPAEGFLVGPQDHWIEQLRMLNSEYRMDSFLLMLGDDVEAQTRAFAEIAAELKG